MTFCTSCRISRSFGLSSQVHHRIEKKIFVLVGVIFKILAHRQRRCIQLCFALLSLSLFHLKKRSQTCHVLQRTCGYLLTDSKGKVTNCVMRVAALLLSPADAILCSSDCPGGRVTYCTVCRCINISIKPPSPRCRSR